MTEFFFGSNSIIGLGNNITDNVAFFDTPSNVSYTSNNTYFDATFFKTPTSCAPEFQGNLAIFNSPNLQYVTIKNGYNHTVITCNEGGDIFQNPALNLTIAGCPSLSFICVDELERPNIQTTINQLGLQSQVEVNSYCSFTPGGTYYTVNGTSRFDTNANGCDPVDASIENQQFTITNNADSGTIIANTSGNYTIAVRCGCAHYYAGQPKSVHLYGIAAIGNTQFPDGCQSQSSEFLLHGFGCPSRFGGFCRSDRFCTTRF